MELKEYRDQIDKIDVQIAELFEKRMDASAGISKYKKEHNIGVVDSGREKEVIENVTSHVRPEFSDDISMLYSMIFNVSRNYQKKLSGSHSDLYPVIQDAIKNTPQLFPQTANVACQGVEGAFSQLAAQKFFKHPKIMNFNTFESVFSAVENGFCEYGVLPLENSSAGSVNKVYELMMTHDFSIVRGTRIKVDHYLLAKPGVKLEDIKEVYSHEQALNQCSEFLSGLKNVNAVACENTAVAASMVSKSDRNDIAAIASRSCMDLYNLSCIKPSIQNRDNNYTRFICISKKLEIYPGADRTSLMMILPHRPGSLNMALSRFYSLGLNLIKLESRPLPEREFEFMFYFDLETSIYSEEFLQMIDELDDMCEEFRYLGSYSEVI
jgi:chorismate mutase/prephenate dehydratase